MESETVSRGKAEDVLLVERGFWAGWRGESSPRAGWGAQEGRPPLAAQPCPWQQRCSSLGRALSSGTLSQGWHPHILISSCFMAQGQGGFGTGTDTWGQQLLKLLWMAPASPVLSETPSEETGDTPALSVHQAFNEPKD